MYIYINIYYIYMKYINIYIYNKITNNNIYTINTAKHHILSEIKLYSG